MTMNSDRAWYCTVINQLDDLGFLKQELYQFLGIRNFLKKKKAKL
jgi:hypothetical protein